MRDQLHAEVVRARTELTHVERERVRLESQLASKERELGSLGNKMRAGNDAHKEEVSKARKDMEEMFKKVFTVVCLTIVWNLSF